MSAGSSSYSDAQWRRAVMVEKKERKTIASVNELPQGYFEDNRSIEGIRFTGLEFDGWKFANSRFRSCEFHQCSFQGCILDEVDFQRVGILESSLEDCNLARGFRYITGVLDRTSLIGCDLSNSFIQNTTWTNCDLGDVDFRSMKAKSLNFMDCTFRNVDLDGAHIVRGDFRGVSGLQRRMFYDVKLDDCEFAWNEAFIVMEFGNPRLDELYTYGIVEVLKKHDVEPRRVDRYEFQGRITDEVLMNIVTSRLVVAECSSTSKNVFFEIGYALGNQRGVIFCIDEAAKIPFDLKDYKFIVHHNRIDELRNQLDGRVGFLLGKR
jgi:hypothetical protein